MKSMTPAQFTEWRQRLGLKRTGPKGASEALGVSKNMPAKYESGEAEIPRYIALACSALAMGYKPYGEL